MTGAFRSTHEDIHICWHLDKFKVNIETMGKTKGIACFQVWRNFFIVKVRLDFVWSQDHDDIRQFRCFCYFISIKAIFLSLVKRLTSTHTDDDIVASVPQVLGMGMTLWTVTNYGDFFAIKGWNFYICFILHFYCHFLCLFSILLLLWMLKENGYSTRWSWPS